MGKRYKFLIQIKIFVYELIKSK